MGSLLLPAGPYVITVSGNLSCTQASGLFTTFLAQWTGNLPGGWKVTAHGFQRGAVGFTVALAKRPPSPPGPPGPGTLTCPGAFSVLHNDKVASVSFPAGNYVVTLLRRSAAFSCLNASRQFALFLAQYSSRPLPSPWTLVASTNTFRTPTGIGFRAAVLPGASPGETSGGGETQGTSCSTIAVTSNDARIDKFVVGRGRYQIWAIGGLSCHQAGKDVARLFALRTSLPKGWKHNVTSSIITVGGGRGLRLKLIGSLPSSGRG